MDEYTASKADRKPLKGHKGLFRHDNVQRDTEREISIVEKILSDAERSQPKPPAKQDQE